MGRARLSDAERDSRAAERKRKTWAGETTRHYDTSTGFGSVEEWLKLAEALVDGKLKVGVIEGVSADLEIMNLTKMPEDAAGLKKAYRNSLFLYHPDHNPGMSDEKVKELVAAFDRLKKHYSDK